MLPLNHSYHITNLGKSSNHIKHDNLCISYKILIPLIPVTLKKLNSKNTDTKLRMIYTRTLLIFPHLDQIPYNQISVTLKNKFLYGYITNHWPDARTLKLMTFLSPLARTVPVTLDWALLPAWRVYLDIKISVFSLSLSYICETSFGNTKQALLLRAFNDFRHILARSAKLARGLFRSFWGKKWKQGVFKSNGV